jgi:dTDP-4-dehydrorhamnose 3,5-epimerase
MNIKKTKIPEVLILEPKVFGDERGFFLESYNQRDFAEMGLQRNFVQDNHSRSARNVLRGLHYQIGQPQGKLVRVVAGAIWDVAVDIRRSSPTFGQWAGEEISADNKRIFWIPEGFAHGFIVLSDSADVLYKATDFYAPACERSLLWNDAQLAISWPLSGEPVLSKKDEGGLPLSQAEVFE